MKMKECTLLCLEICVKFQSKLITILFLTVPSLTQAIDDIERNIVDKYEKLKNISDVSSFLHKEDVEKYKYLMSETLAGVWYKELDPAEVLGLMADNDVEREKYALIMAEINHKKIKKILAFQHAYDRAWRKLYPDSVVATYTNYIETSSGTIQEKSGDRFVFFMDTNDSQSGEVVKKILDRMNYEDLGLDIYAVNSISDNELSQWAKNINICSESVKNGRITLNHDKGRLRRFSKDNALPVVALNRNGEFQVILGDSL